MTLAQAIPAQFCAACAWRIRANDLWSMQPAAVGRNGVIVSKLDDAFVAQIAAYAALLEAAKRAAAILRGGP